MFNFTRRLSPNLTRLSGAIIFCAIAYTANAQTKESSLGQIASPATTTPSALFQFATLTGSGTTITGVLVPVVTSTGAIIYQNITIQFDVSASGALTVASLVTAPAPTPVISSFQAGEYVGPSTINSGENIINVSGPGVATGGITEWSLAAASGASCNTYPGTATWYVGNLADSPLAARVKAAGINTTATTMSFGVASPGACYPSLDWYTDTLIGVSQVKNTLTIVSFTYYGTDKSAPLDQITYTLKP